MAGFEPQTPCSVSRDFTNVTAAAVIAPTLRPDSGHGSEDGAQFRSYDFAQYPALSGNTTSRRETSTGPSSVSAAAFQMA